MRLGRFDLTVVHDGEFRLDGGAMFGVVPKPLWSRVKAADELNRIRMGTNALLVASGRELLLVDTGIGDKLDAKSQAMYGMEEGARRLPEQIRAADPQCLHGIRSSYQTWLAGPLRRYNQGVTELELSIDVNTDCTVRGSYELAYIAHVAVSGAPAKRRFAVFRIKRYDAAKLEECLVRCGWQPTERLPYGTSDRNTITLSLLKKR